MTGFGRFIFIPELRIDQDRTRIAASDHVAPEKLKNRGVVGASSLQLVSMEMQGLFRKTVDRSECRALDMVFNH